MKEEIETKNNSYYCRLWLSLILVVSSTVALAENNAINVNKADVAIHGYDPVAYFTEGRPTPGLASLDYQWSGATWLFSSKANQQAFIDNPERYAPKFGGFCAYAASYGFFADIDPYAWSIIDGALYLNNNLKVRKTWLPRAKEFIGDANQLWPTMRQTEDE